MLKRITFKRICLTTLFLLVALIIYSYPEELNMHISSNYKYEKIYLLDEFNYVSMIDMKTNANSTNERIEEIIESLTINSSSNSDIPEGFKAIIPENTKLLDYSLKDGLLKLNFNEKILEVSMENEEKMLESIIFSLTTIKDINKIMIFINGERLTELPHSHKKLDLYLDRSFGINKVYEITTLNNTKMVTLYYLSQNNNYYIPISKIVNDENDKVEIIINNLKTNTFNNSNLSSHLNYQVELINYELNENTLNMNFNDILLDSIYDGKLKEEVKYSIYYSIYDTLGINEIIFQINNINIDSMNII